MTKLFRKILAPIYFDESSFASVDYAAHFAERNDGRVFLLHVVPTDEAHLLRDVYRPDEGGGANVPWAEKVSKESSSRSPRNVLKAFVSRFLRASTRTPSQESSRRALGWTPT